MKKPWMGKGSNTESEPSKSKEFVRWLTGNADNVLVNCVCYVCLGFSVGRW